MKPGREPGPLVHQTVLIEVMHAKVRPGILERHVHVTCDRSRTEPDLRVGELETTGRTRYGNVERLSIELVDLRPAVTRQHARNFNPCGSAFEI